MAKLSIDGPNLLHLVIQKAIFVFTFKYWPLVLGLLGPWQPPLCQLVPQDPLGGVWRCQPGADLLHRGRRPQLWFVKTSCKKFQRSQNWTKSREGGESCRGLHISQHWSIWQRKWGKWHEYWQVITRNDDWWSNSDLFLKTQSELSGERLQVEVRGEYTIIEKLVLA